MGDEYLEFHTEEAFEKFKASAEKALGSEETLTFQLKESASLNHHSGYVIQVNNKPIKLKALLEKMEKVIIKNQKALSEGTVVTDDDKTRLNAMIGHATDVTKTLLNQLSKEKLRFNPTNQLAQLYSDGKKVTDAGKEAFENDLKTLLFPQSTEVVVDIQTEKHKLFQDQTSVLVRVGEKIISLQELRDLAKQKVEECEKTCMTARTAVPSDANAIKEANAELEKAQKLSDTLEGAKKFNTFGQRTKATAAVAGTILLMLTPTLVMAGLASPFLAVYGAGKLIQKGVEGLANAMRSQESLQSDPHNFKRGAPARIKAAVNKLDMMLKQNKTGGKTSSFEGAYRKQIETWEKEGSEGKEKIEMLNSHLRKKDEGLKFAFKQGMREHKLKTSGYAIGRMLSGTKAPEMHAEEYLGDARFMIQNGLFRSVSKEILDSITSGDKFISEAGKKELLGLLFANCEDPAGMSRIFENLCDPKTNRRDYAIEFITQMLDRERDGTAPVPTPIQREMCREFAAKLGDNTLLEKAFGIDFTQEGAEPSQEAIALVTPYLFLENTARRKEDAIHQTNLWHSAARGNNARFVNVVLKAMEVKQREELTELQKLLTSAQGTEGPLDKKKIPPLLPFQGKELGEALRDVPRTPGTERDDAIKKCLALIKKDLLELSIAKIALKDKDRSGRIALQKMNQTCANQLDRLWGLEGNQKGTFSNAVAYLKVDAKTVGWINKSVIAMGFVGKLLGSFGSAFVMAKMAALGGPVELSYGTGMFNMFTATESSTGVEETAINGPLFAGLFAGMAFRKGPLQWAHNRAEIAHQGLALSLSQVEVKANKEKRESQTLMEDIEKGFKKQDFGLIKGSLTKLLAQDNQGVNISNVVELIKTDGDKFLSSYGTAFTSLSRSLTPEDRQILLDMLEKKNKNPTLASEITNISKKYGTGAAVGLDIKSLQKALDTNNVAKAITILKDNEKGVEAIPKKTMEALIDSTGNIHFFPDDASATELLSLILKNCQDADQVERLLDIQSELGEEGKNRIKNLIEATLALKTPMITPAVYQGFLSVVVKIGANDLFERINPHQFSEKLPADQRKLPPDNLAVAVKDFNDNTRWVSYQSREGLSLQHLAMQSKCLKTILSVGQGISHAMQGKGVFKYEVSWKKQSVSSTIKIFFSSLAHKVATGEKWKMRSTMTMEGANPFRIKNSHGEVVAKSMSMDMAHQLDEALGNDPRAWGSFTKDLQKVGMKNLLDIALNVSVIASVKGGLNVALKSIIMSAVLAGVYKGGPIGGIFLGGVTNLVLGVGVMLAGFAIGHGLGDKLSDSIEHAHEAFIGHLGEASQLGRTDEAIMERLEKAKTDLLQNKKLQDELLVAFKKTLVDSYMSSVREEKDVDSAKYGEIEEALTKSIANATSIKTMHFRLAQVLERRAHIDLTNDKLKALAIGSHLEHAAPNLLGKCAEIYNSYFPANAIPTDLVVPSAAA